MVSDKIQGYLILIYKKKQTNLVLTADLSLFVWKVSMTQRLTLGTGIFYWRIHNKSNLILVITSLIFSAMLKQFFNIMP